MTALLKPVTYSGTGQAWLSVSLALRICQGRGITLVPDQVVFLNAMLCALVAWGVGSLLKRLIDRQRPSESIPGFRPLVATPRCRSFPSSHAASSIALATALTAVHHDWAVGVACWAVLVTFSRFYLGVHFPTDLLGGAILGAICGTAYLPIIALFRGLGI